MSRVIRGSPNPTDEDLQALRADGFTIAVSLLVESIQPQRYQQPVALSAGWTIYSIPIPENGAPSIEQIHEFMVRLRDAPEPTKIVVFCQSGKGRIACMGAAYWIAKCLTTSAAITRMSKACLATDWIAVERRRSLRSLKTP